jgi:hypothetical protein
VSGQLQSVAAFGWEAWWVGFRGGLNAVLNEPVSASTGT